MKTAALDEQISDLQLSRYAKLIYDVTGIRISPQKKTLLSNRLRRRLRATGIKDFEAYYAHLQQTPVDDEEWDRFLQEITTHETFLYRDESHWKWFSEEFLPQIAARAKERGRSQSLRIWSAACSTGDEAYTAAACIADNLPNYTQWNVRILGTDVGIGAIEQAKQATFSERAMRLAPENVRRRYFTEIPGENRWRAKPALSDMTEFKRHNLLDPLCEQPFDLVFLKNVLIYFDKDSKRVAVNNVNKVVRAGTILVAGAAEGVSDLLSGYERLQPWLYVRQ